MQGRTWLFPHKRCACNFHGCLQGARVREGRGGRDLAPNFGETLIKCHLGFLVFELKFGSASSLNSEEPSKGTLGSEDLTACHWCLSDENRGVGGRTDCPHYPTDPEPSFQAQEDPEESLGQPGERTHFHMTLDRVSTQTAPQLPRPLMPPSVPAPILSHKAQC